MSFQFDATAFLDFAEQMGVAASRIQKELLAAGNETAQQGAQIAKSILVSNGSVVTGDLFNSITAKPAQMRGDTIHVEYGPDEQYPAEWVEFGRGPVSARPGGFLRFQIKGVGPYLYRKRVGPARPRPFMRPSVARLQPVANKLFGDAVMRALGEL